MSPVKTYTLSRGPRGFTNQCRSPRPGDLNSLHDYTGAFMSFQEDGFAVLENLLPSAECDVLAARVNSIDQPSAGSRCLLDHAWCRDTANELRTQLAGDLASDLDGVSGSVIVQCTYFHKTSAANWLVPWHQDRSIPVDSQVQSQGLTGWSHKEGMTFVHAPDGVLSKMIAVRLHLDDSTWHNGPLRVIPGSHRHGTLTAEQIERTRQVSTETICIVRKGGVVAMRPLLLHASSKSTTLEPRRVLHFLLAPAQLPDGLEWRCAV